MYLNWALFAFYTTSCAQRGLERLFIDAFGDTGHLHQLSQVPTFVSLGNDIPFVLAEKNSALEDHQQPVRAHTQL